VLVVAGKFDPKRGALAWCTQFFGKLAKPTRVLPVLYTVDPVQDGAREVSVSRVGDSRLLGAMYHIPAGAHPDMAALQLLAYVLGDSPSGRLHRALVEKKLAASADVEVLSLQEPGMLMAFLQLDKTQSPQAARRALLAELEGLRQRPVTEAELKRARQAFKNAYEQALDDPAHFGVALSESIALGDWRLFFLERDRIEAATLAEVQRVAEHYLLAANRTLGEFIPTAKPQRAVIPEAPALDTMLADYRGRAALAAGEAFDASPLNIEQRTQRSVLANGMQLALLAKRTRGNTVQGSLILRLGDAQSLRGKKHAAALTAAMLLRGRAGPHAPADRRPVRCPQGAARHLRPGRHRHRRLRDPARSAQRVARPVAHDPARAELPLRRIRATAQPVAHRPGSRAQPARKPGRARAGAPRQPLSQWRCAICRITG
jgi:zinc protease